MAGDGRYALRAMRRDAGFFAVAVAIVGLGIGASTAIFSVVNALLLRPLPFHEPERLVWIANTGKGGLSAVTSRASTLRDWRQSTRSFDGLTGYFAFFDYVGYNLVGHGEPERCVGVGIAQDFLSVLGVRPLLGRGFTDEESVWHGRPAVLLTHGFWSRRYAGDPGIVGRSITLNDEPTTVVGVLPATFDFASIFAAGSRVDFLVPFPISDQTDRQGNTLAVIGRLRAGVSIETAQAELDVVTRQLKEADPSRAGRWGALVSDLREQVTGQFQRALFAMACAVGLVLLMACINLSSLLLARATSRRKEMALRSALGASRSRLVRQLLTESLLLSCGGAAVGILLATGATRLLASTSAIAIPLLASVTVDAAALLFTLTLAVATGLLFGLVPALQVSGTRGSEALNASSRGSTGRKAATGIRSALVASEVALACVLLVGAGLLLRSFVTLLDVDLGFQPDRAAAWRVETGARYADSAERLAFYERVVRDVASIPGVESVGLTDALPLGRNRTWGARAKGVVYARGQAPVAFPRLVDANYVATMRIPLLAGRGLSEHDTKDKERVILVNQAMARRLWPGLDPVGQIVLVGGGEFRVAGVVGNVRHSSLEEEAGLEMYLPITQQDGWESMELVVRGAIPTESLAGSVKAALRRVDATVPLSDFRPLDRLVERAVSPRRFFLLLTAGFALVALLLASVGIYGVVSYSVSQRTQEIGIRMALGATPANVQARVVARTVGLVAAGIVAGTAAALMLSRLLVTLLYGVEPSDPVTFALISLLLLTVAVLASYLPARRVSRIDPVEVLRSA